MKFLVDRCAGRRLADWLRGRGHDVIEARKLGPDPGDRALLEKAEAEGRILITIDTDFGKLVHLHNIPHAGLVRLPDVPAEQRIDLTAELIEHHGGALEAQAVVTVRDGKLRISRVVSRK
ncbi:MAG: DUF5615 family PIN-like protein [Deltaproteobacteria bacterium]|nr:DUF5615 family PIN-like protein [Deltaproteobacteria bacterium]